LPSNPQFLSETNPLNHIYSEPTALTSYPNHHDQNNDDLEFLQNQPIIFPEDFFEAKKPIESLFEDLPEEKSTHVEIHQDSDQSEEKQDKNQISKMVKVHDDHDDDFLDLQSLDNQSIISPNSPFQGYNTAESPFEDLVEGEKFLNIETHLEAEQSVEKQGKKVISKLIKGENAKGKKKRNMWSNVEDAILLECIEIYRKKWTKIGRMIGGRTGKQVRDRYLNVLIPDIKREEWSEKEDEMIIKMFESIGAQWCQIAEKLEGRTEVQVKNRYYTYLKKVSEGKKILTRPRNPAKKNAGK